MTRDRDLCDLYISGLKNMADVSRLEDAFNWSVSQIARAFEMDRRTVTKRLMDAGVIPSGEKRGHPVYRLKDAGFALWGVSKSASDGAVNDPDDFEPNDRKAWYQSENERVKLEKEMRLLVPIEEVHREMSSLAKALDNYLETLPDLLERDAGLPPEAIQQVESITDQLRDQMFQAIIADEPEDE